MADFDRHFKAGQFSEALGSLDSALRERPDDPDLLYLMACTHRADDHSNRAIPILERVIGIDPKHLDARKLLCIIWTEAGRSAAAAAQIDPLIADGTADSEAYALRATARLRSGDLANAAADAETSLQIDPQTHQALLVRCAVRLHTGQLNEARDDLDAARQAGAPDGSWQPLSQELDRRVAAQKQSGHPEPAP
jgi:tetratricopeptide (TPR) repeat protein